MSPRWERIAAPPPATDAPLVADLVLRPHRSLSRQAFKLMLIAVIAVNLAVAIVFLAHKAFPVAGFCGLDVLALWIAFQINYRAAKAEEHIRIDAEQIHVERRNADGVSAHWVASPVWARASADALGVSIRTGGGALRVGSFLSPAERIGVLKTLDDALWRAKRGGYNPNTSRIE